MSANQDNVIPKAWIIGTVEYWTAIERGFLAIAHDKNEPMSERRAFAARARKAHIAAQMVARGEVVEFLDEVLATQNGETFQALFAAFVAAETVADHVDAEAVAEPVAARRGTLDALFAAFVADQSSALTLSASRTTQAHNLLTSQRSIL